MPYPHRSKAGFNCLPLPDESSLKRLRAPAHPVSECPLMLDCSTHKGRAVIDFMCTTLEGAGSMPPTFGYTQHHWWPGLSWLSTWFWTSPGHWVFHCWAHSPAYVDNHMTSL